MITKALILLAIIHVMATEMVVVNLIDILKQEKIFISNRFKANEIILSDDSRQLAKVKPNFKDFTQVPKLEIEISNIVPQKYFHVHGNIHAYVFRAVMGLEQFRKRFKEKSARGRYQVVLMRKSEEEEVRKVVKDARLCFYQGQIIRNEQLHEILKECLKDKQVIISHPVREQQNNVNSQSGLKIFMISLLTCAALAAGKMLKLRQIAKKDSVV